MSITRAMQCVRITLAILMLAGAGQAAPAGIVPATRGATPAVVGPDVELATPSDVPVGTRRHRYYRQQLAGAPVLGCGVDEVVDDAGQSIMQAARLCATVASAPVVVSGVDAAAIARNSVVQQHPADRIVPGTAVAAYRATGAPVWMVDVATSAPWNVFRVFVDAASGAVLRTSALARDARGSVFATTDAAAHHSAGLRRLRNLDPAVDTLSGSDFLVDDVNDFLALCDATTNLFCTPAGSDTCAAKGKHGVFQYTTKASVQIGSCTQNDRFDQVTGYYQLSEMANYFRLLGWDPGSGALAGQLPMPVLVNVPFFVNAYFAPPSSGAPAHMAFGDEATGIDLNDFTNDPTVPRHEFTHAIVYDASGGLNDDDTCITDCSPYAGAMNEGFADYFAIQSLGGKQTVVAGQLGKYVGDGAARDIDNDLRFPCDLTHEVHDDGRIWSGFLLDAKRVLGKGFDAAVVRSIAGIPHGLGRSLGFGEAFEAILAELPPLSEKTTLTLVQEATRRGVLGAFAKDRGTAVAVDSGDAAWGCAPTAVCDQVTDDTLGFSAASVVTDSTFPGGLAARTIFDANAPLDLRGKQVLHFRMYAAPTPAAGDLQLVFDDDPSCTSPLVTIDLPAFDAAGGLTERTVQFTGSDALGAVACVGLVTTAGAHQVLIDQIDTGVSQFGPVVLPIQAGSHLTLKNHFPLPHGDDHFYYFIPPAGAATITIKAQANGATKPRSDLRYCGAVTVSGNGDVPPEISAMHLWTYDPSQPIIPIQVTLLPVDSHQLVAGISAKGARTRSAKKLPLPPSPTGVYAVSLDGSGNYTIKLSFE